MIRKKVKTLLLDSNNQLIRKLGMLLYNWFLMIVNGRISAFIQYKPFMDDRRYIEKNYEKVFKVKPNLDNPLNFNEKNNWRKLNDRNPQYTCMVDKYRIKEIVRNVCGEGYTFPLLGVWDKPRQINFDTLPEKFVLKVNHAGGVIICRDKKVFDKKKAICELNRDLHKNYYWASREWPYKNVERKIIAETYMGENLIDYKNYCFDGKLVYTFVWLNESRQDGRKPEAFFCGAYDREWNKIIIDINYPSKDISFEKPICYEEMVVLAEKMSKDIPFVRVDCYCIDGKPYLGEMTFFPWGGFMKFSSDEWNLKLGELEKLPQCRLQIETNR